MSEKFINTPYADFTLLDDGIVMLKFTRSGELEVHEAIDILKVTKDLTNNSMHALIYDFNKQSVHFSKEVRAMAEKRSAAFDNIFARAFICYNLSNKLEVNHFIKFNKPQTPTEIFKDKNDAVTWAYSLRKEVLQKRSDIKR